MKYLPLLIILILAFVPKSYAQQVCIPSSPSFLVKDTIWGTQASPFEASPGDTNVPLSINLLYYGSCVITSLKAKLTLPHGFEGSNGELEPIAYATSIAPNTIFQIIFRLNIANDVAAGKYNLQLHVLWNTTSSYATQDLNASIFLPGRAEIFLSTTQNSLLAGSVNEVELEVRNIGSGSAREVRVQLTPSPNISVLGWDGIVGNIGPNESKKIKLMLVASSLPQITPVSISYSGSYMNSYSQERAFSGMLGFYIYNRQSLSPISISVEPYILGIAKLNNVSVTISNLGNSTITNISLSFSFSYGSATWLGPSTFNYRYLKPNSEVKVNGLVYVPQSQATYLTMSINLAYHDYSGNSIQEVRNVGLIERGIANLTVTDISTIPVRPEIGKIFSVTVSLSNLGNIPALAVIATANPPNGIDLFGSRSLFIGDMQLNSPATFTFSFIVDNSTSPGAYKIPISLSYMDNLRERINQTIILDLQLVKASSPIGQERANTANYNQILVLSSVLVALMMGYFIGRKRRGK